LTWHVPNRIITEVGAIPAKTKEEEYATDTNIQTEQNQFEMCVVAGGKPPVFFSPQP
jgi:hypothetical protein